MTFCRIPYWGINTVQTMRVALVSAPHARKANPHPNYMFILVKMNNWPLSTKWQGLVCPRNGAVQRTSMGLLLAGWTFGSHSGQSLCMATRAVGPCISATSAMPSMHSCVSTVVVGCRDWLSNYVCWIAKRFFPGSSSLLCVNTHVNIGHRDLHTSCPLQWV